MNKTVTDLSVIIHGRKKLRESFFQRSYCGRWSWSSHVVPALARTTCHLPQQSLSTLQHKFDIMPFFTRRCNLHRMDDIITRFMVIYHIILYFNFEHYYNTLQFRLNHVFFLFYALHKVKMLYEHYHTRYKGLLSCSQVKNDCLFTTPTLLHPRHRKHENYIPIQKRMEHQPFTSIHHPNHVHRLTSWDMILL